MVYAIYEIWYLLFSVLLPSIPEKFAGNLIDHGIHLINELYKKQITPNRSLYSKLIRACGRLSLVNKINQIFLTMPQNSRNSNPLYYNAFINDYSFLMKVKSDDSMNNNIRDSLKNKNSGQFLRQSSLLNQANIKISDYVKEILDVSIFVPYDYCPNCYKSKKIKKINLDEIIGGFKKDDLKYCSKNDEMHKYSIWKKM